MSFRDNTVDIFKYLVIYLSKDIFKQIKYDMNWMLMVYYYHMNITIPNCFI